MKDEEWTKKDGTKIMVSDMTESHAKATLRMLIRNSNRVRNVYQTDPCNSNFPNLADEGDKFGIY